MSDGAGPGAVEQPSSAREPTPERIAVGAVIRRVFDIYVEQAPVLMPAAAVVFVFTGLLSTVVLNASAGLRLLSELISLVASMLFTGMVVELVADVQDGRRDAGWMQLLRSVTPVLWPLIVVGIVAGLGVLVGLLLLIVPGLVLLTVWSVAAPVVVLERPPALAALGRSRALVRGHGWQVFGVLLVLDVLVAVAVGALSIAAEAAGTGAGIVVTVVLGVLAAPLSALAAAVLYFELRARAPAAGTAAAPGAIG